MNASLVLNSSESLLKHPSAAITPTDVILILLTSLISFVCSSASILVCIVIYKDPLNQLRSPFSPYVFNLNFSGSLVGSAGQGLFFAQKVVKGIHQIYPYYEICFIVLSSSTVLSLCVLCVDRYSAMVHPFQYRTRDRTKRWIILIGIVWTVSVIYPSVMYTYHGLEMVLSLFFNVIVTGTFLVLILTTTIILVTSNVQRTDEQSLAQRISRKLSSLSIDFVDAISHYTPFSFNGDDIKEKVLVNVFNKKPSKMGQTFGLMIMEYVVCFLPPLVLVNKVDKNDKESIETLHDVVHVFVLMFVLLNPFIYCWRHCDYRTAFWNLAGCKQPKRKSSKPLGEENIAHDLESILSKSQFDYPNILEDVEMEQAELVQMDMVRKESKLKEGQMMTERGNAEDEEFEGDNEDNEANHEEEREKEDDKEEDMTVEFMDEKNRKESVGQSASKVRKSARRKQGMYQLPIKKFKYSFSDPGDGRNYDYKPLPLLKEDALPSNSNDEPVREDKFLGMSD